MTNKNAILLPKIDHLMYSLKNTTNIDLQRETWIK